MMRRAAGLVAKFWRGERGAVAPLVALMTVILVGITGFAVDMGHVMWVQRQLQTAADAAALAGAQDVVDNPSNAVPLATSYSATAGNKNAFLASAVTTTAVLKCFTSVTFPACGAGSGGNNGIQVTESTVVPMWFAQIVGIRNMTVTAQASASAKGGSSTALDIMIVLDNTPSMGNWDSACTYDDAGHKGAQQIACAKYGVRQLLKGLNPAVDRVGVMVFPGYTTQPLALSSSHCKVTESISKYGPYNSSSTAPYFSGGPYYMVTGLDNTFFATNSDGSYVKNSDGTPVLSSDSSVVVAVGGGSTCGSSSGIQKESSLNTYYAQALLAAATVLQSDGSSKSQKVIVFLSDGDATMQSKDVLSSVKGSALTTLLSDQCQQGVAAAQYAATQGMWVYSVAYGASITGRTVDRFGNVTGSCKSDSSKLGTAFGHGTTVNMTLPSGCATMQGIASDASKFYSDNAHGCNGTAGNDRDLAALFKDIAASLTQPRLIPNNTT